MRVYAKLLKLLSNIIFLLFNMYLILISLKYNIDI
jgi:hypothetical protein